MSQLLFDEETHTYTLDGERLPNVTSILDPLNDLWRVPPDILERARLFGTAVHKTVEFYEAGDLDEATLDPALVRVLAQYKEAIRQTGWRVVESELIVYHPTFRYAGKLDLIVEVPGARRLALVDVKSGSVTDSAGPQTAAYQKGYEAMERGAAKIGNRYRLRLTETDYHVDALNDPTDWNIFQSCLNVHTWRKNHGLKS
ncbi:MAG: PD-(D/E)XK nuclease family protein [Nitrosospira sp.]|nr:PD-(D/E)XK nuclease family protein [Nitrosospira sp.]